MTSEPTNDGSVRSVTTQLEAEAKSMANDLAHLVRQHSGLSDVNKRSGGVVFVGASHAWKELSTEGAQLRSKLLRDLDHFSALVSALLVDQPTAVTRQIAQHSNAIRGTVEQSHLSWHATTEDALQASLEALGQILIAIHRLYDPTEGTVVFVPDTNALLFNPELERWQFPEVHRFTLVLVPAVLSELDSLKINHRNPDVREKAEGLIRRIKEYRRRGELAEGVTLVQGVVLLRTVAKEPNMEKTLPWLDPVNADDRFLAAVLEVMRLHPRSAVQLVTRDINLQNKAEFAKVPFVEPPETTARAASPRLRNRSPVNTRAGAVSSGVASEPRPVTDPHRTSTPAAM